MLKIVKEIAEHLGLSQIRIRQVLGKQGAPSPVIKPRLIGGAGKAPGKYDLDEFLEFYEATKGKPGRPFRSDVDFWRMQ